MFVLRRFYARNASVQVIDKDVAQDFVDLYHKQQAASPSTSVTSVGLFVGDELVGVAQFCSPRTSAKKREYTTELLRLCFKVDVRVVGGASKLISFFKKTFKPSDIFTYQDTTGENSDVYEKSGFSFVSEDRVKQYLIAPDKTFETASRKEKLSVAYAVRLGPDNILGTSLGEIFNEDGSRKSNLQIFTEVLGWTVHETSGDKVWEWFNEDITFYTYKITASDSDKYYYGMRKLNVGNATMQDCLDDPYMGSGGKNLPNNKFVNWKNKHSENLHKEVLKTFKKKTYALQHERELVGDSWKTDQLCLNSAEGGRYTGKQSGASPRWSSKECLVHGVVTHAGDSCATCSAEKPINESVCEIHGETTFTGKRCRKCINSKIVNMKICNVHGETKHFKDDCYKCTAHSFKSESKVCEIHGDSKHVNDKCVHCFKDELIIEKICEIHGLSKYLGDSCYKCFVTKSVSLKECPTHGLVNHFGDSCATCSAVSAVSLKVCEIHGETKHVGDSCASCRTENNITTDICIEHGKTKHIGEKCFKCRKSGFVLSVCEIHGETSFSSGNCRKCAASDSMSFQVCVTHGETQHMYDACILCRSAKAVDLKVCVIHGETKHRGKKCYKCLSDEITHNRYHFQKVSEKSASVPSKTNLNCRLCVQEIESGFREAVEVVENFAKVDPVCGICDKSFKAKNKNQVFCSNPHPTSCFSCGDPISPTPRKGQRTYSCMKKACRTLKAELKLQGKA